MSGAFKKLKKVGSAINPVNYAFDLLGGVKNLTKVKTGKDAPVTPIPDFEEIALKQKRAMARKKRKGRASTVLTEYEGAY
jgi:hypothetical protein